MKKAILILFVLCNFFTVSAQNLRQSVENGIQTSIRQSENREWREAFATCRALDTMIGQGNPDLHYLVAKERFRLYYRINKMAECKKSLALMETYARQSGKNAIIEDMLMKKAGFLLSYGSNSQAVNCYKEVFNMHAGGKDDAGKEKAFREMISKAKQEKNNLMAEMLSKMYSAWTDSINNVKAANELKTLKNQYAAAQEDIDSKATKITAQWVFIVILIVIAVGLCLALGFFVLLMFKNVRQIKQLKASLSISDSNNVQKNMFLNNISKQIRPSLDAMEAGDAKRQIKALQAFMASIENYMSLEQSRDSHYELSSKNMGQLCEKMAAEAKKMVKAGVNVTFNSQPITFSTNDEALSTLVLGIVREVSKNENVERISLEFKKRNPHTGHFLITVVGMKLAEEKRQSLFTAFSEIVDLTEGDGLTYPTCGLMALKLNGLLRLDEEYRQGTRFIVELKD